MVEVCGKPFLEYQIEQLRDQGFERVLLLLGYLPKVIRDYFGDGQRWGLRIDYSVSAVDDDTGKRVKLAEPYLDPCFMLMYCDNYWPMRFDRMWEFFRARQVSAMVTVYSNKDAYTQNSVRVESNGLVSVYDKSRSHPDLNGVEISYAIMNKDVVGLLGDENLLFETTVYPPLVERKQLAGFVTDHRYYSVGSHRKLPLTESFLRRNKAVLLDRDGVLNKRPPSANYVSSWSEFEWLPGAKTALRLLRENGFRVIVVSNQAGVARGAMTERDLGDIHDRMQREVEASGGHLDAIYYCPHDWDAGCECRKPKPGMLFQAQREFDLNLSRTWFIGDDDRDEQAAETAGCRFVGVSDRKPILDCVQAMISQD
jgi:D-glycero-D-manno-heptose 1,7-bisphosphate phosphatase